MSRSLVLEKINVLTQRIKLINDELKKPNPLGNNLYEKYTMLTQHRDDLQDIYNAYLYKLP